MSTSLSSSDRDAREKKREKKHLREKSPETHIGSAFAARRRNGSRRNFVCGGEKEVLP